MAKAKQQEAPRSIAEDPAVLEAQALHGRVAGRVRDLAAERSAAEAAIMATSDSAAVATLLEDREPESHRSLEQIDRDSRIAIEAERKAQARLESARREAAKRIRSTLDAKRAEVLSGLAGAMRGLVGALEARREFLDLVEADLEATGMGCESGEWFNSTFSAPGLGEAEMIEALDGWLGEHERTGFRNPKL